MVRRTYPSGAARGASDCLKSANAGVRIKHGVRLCEPRVAKKKSKPMKWATGKGNSKGR